MGYGLTADLRSTSEFSGAVTLAGNPVTLTPIVGALSQISQNSANAVLINTPLKLDVSATLGGTGNGLMVISKCDLRALAFC